MSVDAQTHTAETDIAIVGMSAHLPGADTLAAYWHNLRNGLRAIRRLSEDDLIAAGEDPAVMRNANYVPFAAPLDRFADFDAEFFGFSPKEAAILDPQHRQFLEVAWEAMENAGTVPERFDGNIGVYAGCGMGSYFYFNLCSNRDLVRDVGMFLLRHTGNDKDFLSTRVSHIFDLRGPSVNVQTACSTSLVALHYATQALLSGECDMALAGGVTIELPQGRGYLYKENEILSPDGECHAFDHRAQGTVFGSGAGCVALKRLADAQRDGDHIWAVVKGSAINNDGAQKAGYLAPSVEGQARCIAEAQMVADTPANTVDYIECHGTGTYLGDPIEVAAMTEAFRETTDETGFCRIGSVKTNIGHLDTAAGVASVIKVALSLHHKEIPPSLGFEAPNPTIDFETSPFAVNAVLTPWEQRGHPRRAAVNALGVGGTNAHAIFQEAPVRPASEESDWPFQLLTLSARNKTALDSQSRNMAAHLREASDQDLADIAWTLHNGRRAFDKRRVVVAESHAEAATLLEADSPLRVFTHTALENPDVVFLFPGGGAQYAGMARDLYETEPVFAEWMDRGLEILQPRLDYDLRALWLPENGAEPAANETLKKPSVQLPLIMITEYALAQMFMAWGIQPSALVGHSMGENTAACLAGVLSFEDCIGLVHLRGTLFDTVPAGGMLSVPMSVEALQPYLGDLDLASVNAPELTVISGPDAGLDDLAARLLADGVDTQRIAINIAAHSRMLEPILGRFRAYLASIPLQAPRLPIISNTTGEPLTDEQATSPDYWTQHLRGTVMFADCVSNLAERPNRIWLEVGPGKALSSLTRMHGAVPAQQVLAALRHPEEDISDDLYHMGLLGRIWALGGKFDWAQIWGDARRNTVPLPTYPFDRREYFIAPAQPSTEIVSAVPARIEEVSDMGTRLSWVPRSADIDFDIDTDLDDASRETWLIFADQDGIAAPAIARMKAAGQKVIEVQSGDTFRRRTDNTYSLPTERGREGYDQLIQDLVHRGTVPTRIAHFWLASGEERFRPGSNAFQAHLEQGFYSLLFLSQAIAAEGLSGPMHMTVITAGAAKVKDEALAWPEKAMIAGPARVMPHEMPGFTVSTLDIDPRTRKRGGHPDLASALLEELFATPANTTAALRNGKRYEQRLRPQALTETPDLPQGAPWVITGGFGGIGQTVAEALITASGAKIALIARTALPDRSEWAARTQNPADPIARRILAVEHLESLGAEVMVAAADVCNIDEMRSALDAVRAKFGTIHGVIHAAGAIDDAPMLAKTVSSIEGVFAPKVHGLRVLDALLPDGAVNQIVVFASTSTLTAPAGQVDYVAANEYLNAWARARHGKTKVLSLNWGIWSEVGMAAEAMAERLGLGPTMPDTPTTVPLLDTSGFDAKMNRQFKATYSTDMWMLNEHRTKDGKALVPGTGMLEIAVQSLHGQGEVEPFEIADLTFFRALEVDQPREIRVTLTRSDAGYDFELRSDVILRGRKGFALNAQARIEMGSMTRPAPLDVAAISARCPDNIAEDPAGMPTGQEAHLAFGPRWRVLNRRAFGQSEGLAHLSLPAAFRDDLGEGYILHPALTDLATGWAMELIPGYQGRALWVPVSYGRVRVYRALPAEIVSHVRISPAEPGFASFDITLATPEGDVCAEISRFTIKRLDAGFGAPAPLLPSEVEFDHSSGEDRALNPGEERLARNLAMGITPNEGATAFLRALSVNQPQVVISSLTLPELIAEAAKPLGAEIEEGQKFERPDLDSDYVEPRNDVERMLVSMWEELLGVQGVGVEDSFFDLGGHSLIAVRLFARVKKTWAVDFPISVLFEAPTVEKIAARVAEVTGITETGDAPAPAKPVRRYEFLVPMHEGEGGPKTPFFLVAGMFGNVLNLRHLAQLLGKDRPFYGLQARGLLGDALPHARLDDAARDYLAEVRQIQPHGPYLLGGFSGGGLTALEMAKQLRAAGEEVSLLTMLDTPLPMRPTLSRADKAMIKLHEFRRKGPGYVTEWLQARRDWKQELAQMAEGGEAESGFQNRAIEGAFRDALPHVALELYDAPVALFRPPLDKHWKVTGGHWISRAKEYVFDDNEWSPWMPKLTVHEVPGDHDSMVLEPNVRVMASKLRSLISEAEA